MTSTNPRGETAQALLERILPSSPRPIPDSGKALESYLRRHLPIGTPVQIAGEDSARYGRGREETVVRIPAPEHIFYVNEIARSSTGQPDNSGDGRIYIWLDTPAPGVKRLPSPGNNFSWDEAEERIVLGFDHLKDKYQVTQHKPVIPTPAELQHSLKTKHT